MKVLGCIVEYNPFHNGHGYHLAKSKEENGCTHAVAIMSGNFVQRGEPAILDKYVRTRLALEQGVDLVLELPLFYATSSAEGFAQGAVQTLHASGIVNVLSFGSESGDIQPLRNTAKFLNSEPPLYKQLLHQHLQLGYSYHKARDLSLRGCEVPSPIQPNEVLAVEYLKELDKIKSGILPYTLKRNAAQYHDQAISSAIASATAIRHAFFNNEMEKIKKTVPGATLKELQILKNNYGVAPHLNQFSQIFHYIMRTKSPEDIREIMDVTEGIENRIVSLANQFYNISEIIKHLKTKRYAYTKLQRTILHIILGMKKTWAQDLQDYGLPYIRVLGFRKNSIALLSIMCKKANIPVIINLKYAEKLLTTRQLSYLKKEVESTDLYYLATKNTSFQKQWEYSQPIVTI